MAIKVCCACGKKLSRQTTQLCRRCYLSGTTRICVSQWKLTKNKELIKKDLEIFDRLINKKRIQEV